MATFDECERHDWDAENLPAADPRQLTLDWLIEAGDALEKCSIVLLAYPNLRETVGSQVYDALASTRLLHSTARAEWEKVK